jgi:hypothetical protein
LIKAGEIGMGRGRPGGNPDLQEHQFQAPEGKEPNNARLALWIPQSMMDELKEQEDKNQFVREAIAAALKKQKRPSRTKAKAN